MGHLARLQNLPLPALIYSLLRFSLFFKAEIFYKKNPKMLNQFQFCEENGVPFCVVIGESEIEKGVVTLREMSSRKEVTTTLCWSLVVCCCFYSG